MFRVRAPGQARDEHGFTLIELLIVMVVMGIVGGLVVTSFVSTARGSTVATRRLDAINDLTPAMQRMTRDLRSAAPLLIDAGGNYLSEVGTEFVRGGQTFRTLYRLETSDGVVNLLADRLVKDASGSFVAAGTSFLVTQVDNDLGTDPVFTYYDGDGSRITCTDATAACRDEHLTASRLELRVLRAVEGGDPIEYQTSINIRNTRYGTS